MDSPKFFKTDPATLLLHEIDILLAQTRLMELYLKQSRAAAVNETARIREEYQAELRLLRSRLSVGEVEHPAIAAEKTMTGVPEQKFQDPAFLTQLSEKQRLLEECDAELQRAKSETAILRDRVAELEMAHEQSQAVAEEFATHREGLQVELAGLRHQLDKRQADSEKQQLISRALQEGLEEQLTELQVQLREKQSASQGAVIELQQARIEINALRAQIAELRGDAEKSNLGQTLRNELDRLVREAEEKNQILQDRNDELVRVKAEMDSLQERFTELDLSTTHTQGALAGESERMRTEFQAQLVLLQAELSQKQWALEELDATARGLEQTCHQEIESLRRRLAEMEAAHKTESHEYVIGEARLARAEDERFRISDSAESGNHHSKEVVQSRRWHSGFAWKRRWKS